MSDVQSTKRCGACKVEKPASAFHLRRRSKDGLQGFCKACSVKRTAAWNKAHPEKRETWRRNNLHRERATCAAWRHAHPDQVRKYGAKYARKHPAKMRQKCAVRRARKRATTVGESKDVAAFYAFVAAADRIACHWCGKSVPKGKRHVDHIVPLARGGKHVVWNLCCACQRCNNRKHAKTPAEFTGQHELVFA